MTECTKRLIEAKVIAMLEEILVELDNLQLSLPALKIVEALDILSGRADSGLAK